MQFEAGGGAGVGVVLGILVGVMRGVGVGDGVVIWLGIDSNGIEVGAAVGCEEVWKLLWLIELLVMELDDDERVDATVPHADTRMINERNNRPQQNLFKTIPLSYQSLHAQCV